MNQLSSGLRVARVLVGLTFVVACASSNFSGIDAAFGQSNSPTIVRVEEDWELVVKSPDANSTAPQVTCAFSPVGHVDSVHATFELNHQSLPHFQSGGLQLQVWDGDIPRNTHKFPKADAMSQPQEVVRWTQCMEVGGGSLLFEIRNGTSSTWGAFGGQGYLKATVGTGLVNLNGYSPEVSAKHSGIGYAANRVESLVLKRVRITTDKGQTLEYTTPLVVHPAN